MDSEVLPNTDGTPMEMPATTSVLGGESTAPHTDTMPLADDLKRQMNTKDSRSVWQWLANLVRGKK